MRQLLPLIFAALLSACAQTHSGPLVHQRSGPNLGACQTAIDQTLCLLRVGMNESAGFAPRDYATFLEMADPRDLSAVRAALAFGLDTGPDAIQLGDDRLNLVSGQRAIMQALRLDASGAAPDAALAPIEALADEQRAGYQIAYANVRFNALIELARWQNPFVAHRPSAALVRRALERAEALALADGHLEARSNLISNIAASYGHTNLRAEGVAFLERVAATDDFELLALVGDLDAAEAVVRRAAPSSVCPPAIRADGFSMLAFYAEQDNDTARELRLMDEAVDNALATLDRCQNTRARFPSVWRLAELRSPDAARAMARQLAPYTTSWQALEAQRSTYDITDDDAEICRIAHQQAATDPQNASLPYVLEGQSYCRPALEAWRDETLHAEARLIRGIDAGVPQAELDAFIQSTEDRSIVGGLSLVAYRALKAGRTQDAEHFAALYVARGYNHAIGELDNVEGELPWRGVLYRVIAPDLLQLVLRRVAEDEPGANLDAPATSIQQETARRAAAAVLAYELETGLRTLPAR